MFLTHKILLKQTGEISYTPRDPVAVYEEGSVDLSETTNCIWSSDDWRQVSVDTWEVREITLPHWLPASEWIRSTTAWKWAWGCGADGLPETWQRALAYGNFSCAERLACAKLLKTKSFRSEFRVSLRMQLVAWIERPEDREYDSPFSPRQWDKLVNQYIERDAKYLDNALYRNRQAAGYPTEAAA